MKLGSLHQIIVCFAAVAALAGCSKSKMGSGGGRPNAKSVPAKQPVAPPAPAVKKGPTLGGQGQHSAQYRAPETDAKADEATGEEGAEESVNTSGVILKDAVGPYVGDSQPQVAKPYADDKAAVKTQVRRYQMPSPRPAPVQVYAVPSQPEPAPVEKDSLCKGGQLNLEKYVEYNTNDDDFAELERERDAYIKAQENRPWQMYDDAAVWPEPEHLASPFNYCRITGELVATDDQQFVLFDGLNSDIDQYGNKIQRPTRISRRFTPKEKEAGKGNFLKCLLSDGRKQKVPIEIKEFQRLRAGVAMSGVSQHVYGTGIGWTNGALDILNTKRFNYFIQGEAGVGLIDGSLTPIVVPGKQGSKPTLSFSVGGTIEPMLLNLNGTLFGWYEIGIDPDETFALCR